MYIYVSEDTQAQSGFPRRYAIVLSFGSCRLDKPGLSVGMLAREIRRVRMTHCEQILVDGDDGVWCSAGYRLFW